MKTYFKFFGGIYKFPDIWKSKAYDVLQNQILSSGKNDNNTVQNFGYQR